MFRYVLNTLFISACSETAQGALSGQACYDICGVIRQKKNKNKNKNSAPLSRDDEIVGRELKGEIFMICY